MKKSAAALKFVISEIACRYEQELHYVQSHYKINIHIGYGTYITRDLGHFT
jgi:hypothetical protein